MRPVIALKVHAVAGDGGEKKKKNGAVLKGITRGERWYDSLLDIRWTWPRAEMELVS